MRTTDVEHDMGMLAEAGYNAFLCALNSVELCVWDDLEDVVQAGLISAVARFLDVVEDVTDVAWRDLAAKAYESYAIVVDLGREFHELPSPKRAAWEAFVRHVFSVAEADVNPGDLDQWRGWAFKRVGLA